MVPIWWDAVGVNLIGGLFLFLMDEKHACRGGHTCLRMLVSKPSLVRQSKRIPALTCA